MKAALIREKLYVVPSEDHDQMEEEASDSEEAPCSWSGTDGEGDGATHKNVLLMVPTPVCSAKLLTFRTKTTFQILFYMVLCHRPAQHSVPDDYSLQDIVSEE